MSDQAEGGNSDGRPKRENAGKLPAKFEDFETTATGRGTGNLPVDPASKKDEAPDDASSEESSATTVVPQVPVSKASKESQFSSVYRAEKVNWDRQSSRSHRTRRSDASEMSLSSRIHHQTRLRISPLARKYDEVEKKKRSVQKECKSLEQSIEMHQGLLEVSTNEIAKRVLMDDIAKSKGQLQEKRERLNDLESKLMSLDNQIHDIESEKSIRLFDLSQQQEDEDDDDRDSVSSEGKKSSVKSWVEQQKKSLIYSQFDVQPKSSQTAHLPPHQSQQQREFSPGPQGLKVPSILKLEEVKQMPSKEKVSLPTEEHVRQLEKYDPLMKPLSEEAERVNEEYEEISKRLNKVSPFLAMDMLRVINDRSTIVVKAINDRRDELRKGIAAYDTKIQLPEGMYIPNLKRKENPKFSSSTPKPSVGTQVPVRPSVSQIPGPFGPSGSLGPNPLAPPGPQASYLQASNQADVNQQLLLNMSNLMLAQQAASSSANSDVSKFTIRQSVGRDLPRFDGNPRQWPTFKTAFDETTRICGYTDHENLMRLEKCLGGEARKMVYGKLVSPNNVKGIIENLEIHFGEPELVIKSLMKDVENCSTVREDRLADVIDFGAAVDNLISGIIALNRPNYLETPLLMSQIEVKLSTGKKVEWFKWRTLKQLDNTLKNFGDWMKLEIRAARAFTVAKETKDLKPESNRPKSSRQVFYADGQAKFSNQRTESSAERSPKKKNPRDKPCSHCNLYGHRITSCQDFVKLTMDDKWKVVKSKQLCVCCLNEGHMSKDCRSKKPCKYEKCEKNHHPLMHSEPKKSSTVLTTEEKKSDETHPDGGGPSTAESYYVKRQDRDPNGSVNLMVLPVRLKSRKGAIIYTFAMLDTASTTTFIRQDMVDRLGIQGKKATIKVKTFHPDPVVVPCEIVSFKIMPERGPEAYNLSGVRAVESLPLTRQSVTRGVVKKWKHLRDLKDLSTFTDAEPTVLIGMDNSYFHTQLQVVEGPRGSPTAARTRLGWALYGQCNSGPQHFSFFMSEEESLAELHREVKEHFHIDSLGVKVTDLKARSSEDQRAQKILDVTTQRVGDGWETGLLWRHDDVRFPESYTQALRRLQTQERKMDKDPLFAEQLMGKIQEYLAKGYVQKLKPEEITPCDKAYYLPYFGVKNPNKPKKFRLVFDAASKSHGVSLNDMLLPGPDKLTPLLEVLMKFRQRAVAVTGDLRDMFHRVAIRKEDLPAQRFLFRGFERNKMPEVYNMRVMIFGSACSPCAAQEVKNKNALEFQDQFPEAVNAIVNKHYVDDYLDAFDSVEEAQKVVKEVILIHSKGNFTICNWTTNFPEVLQAIPEELQAPQKEAMDLVIDKMLVTERVLGLHWIPETDEFTFVPKFHRVAEEVIQGSRVPTKREALSLIMSVYDPLGFLANFVVTAKIILQRAWKTQIGWDDEIPKSSHPMWYAWIEELQKISKFRLPRCYSSCFMKADVQLHMFVDSSEDAYAAVGYFRINYQGGIQSRIVMAKCRVAPIKYVSMPRLELQAAVLGSRLAKTILSYHEKVIPKTFFWSDSRTVICWLKSESRTLSPFVAHRVGEIQEETNVADWKWIPTKENVADEATRASNKFELEPESRWSTGPAFLQLPEDQWPKEEVKLDDQLKQEVQVEMKKEFFFMVMKESFMDIERFSNYNRLIRSTAYVLRFIAIIRGKPRKSEFSPDELLAAEKIWWKIAQEEGFAKENRALKDGQVLPKKSLLQKLSAFHDQEGILRMEGRLQQAPDLPYETRNPVILPPKHPFTRLMVMEMHIRCKHLGQEQVTNELRRLYYIPSMRGVVRSVWAHCQLCQNRRAYPKPPKMGQLPRERIEAMQRPFTNTGVDYFGPMEVTVGRRHEKRYGCLFTCMATRAIHLEIANELSTDSFLMCLIRFIAIRGCPRVMHSDNGTNFVGANNELQQLIQNLDDSKVGTFCAKRGIDWKFICPRASHHGGAWERMVRAVKEGLKMCLKEKYPREETLQTAFREVQRLVNGHPLTYMTSEDGGQALTPNHFLWGTSDGSQLPLGDFCDKDLLLKKQWRVAVRLSEHFWQRWLKEYLPTLLKREKWTEDSKPLQVGDIGVLVDEVRPRQDWPIGKVIRVLPGKDGIVRTVEFETATGIYKRPVHKIGIFSFVEDFVPKSGGSVAEEEPKRPAVMNVDEE